MTRRARITAALGSAALSSTAARAAYTLLSRKPPGRPGTWTRTNHRGEEVTLVEGPAVAVAAATVAAVAPGLHGRARAALAVAGAGAAAFGCYDDLTGSGDNRGFRGHLGALAHGEVTSGAVKIVGIGSAGLAAGAVLGGPPVDVAINACLTAGGANLLNLFDLRPGRAIKVALLGGGLLAAGAPGGKHTLALRVVAAPAGAAIALLPEDLGERAMLGDAGANALGAMLGAAAAASLPRGARIALLAGIAGLTAASEVVSFTKVIERTPPLRWLDMLGRRPLAPRRDEPAGPPSEPSPVQPEPWSAHTAPAETVPAQTVPEQAAADFP
jgi:UDP-GlcNAc:undecaprenyl-phosphate/decaprenyl-phosphate GlcNAc-1-phosphate transferase